MSSSSSKKVIIAALVGNGLIAVTKFVASTLTGSSAMLSEAIHSLVDTGNQCLLLYGLKRAQRPPDEEFPYGYGKEIYFWSFVVAIAIFSVGAGVSIYEGIQHIRHPVEMRDPMVNYVVLGLALVFEGAAWWFAWREFKKTKGEMGYIQAVKEGKDPSMFVVLFEDSAAMAGLLVALVGVYLTASTGNPLYDGIASVVIGTILALTAVWLAVETKGLLIGESAHPEVRAAINDILAENGAVDKINEVLTMHMGPEFILVNVSVDFNDRLAANDIEQTVSYLAEKLKAQNPLIKRVFVEAREFST
ncbi:MAG: cation diffusion facilitator family transporter [Pseudomonadales bacterium]